MHVCLCGLLAGSSCCAVGQSAFIGDASGPWSFGIAEIVMLGGARTSDVGHRGQKLALQRESKMMLLMLVIS